MFRKIDDFLKAYEALNGGTIKLLDQLPDDKLDQSVGEERRTLRQLGWHIVVTVPEMMKLAGLPLSAVDPESKPPQSKTEIIEGYKLVAEELVGAVKAGWNDDSLTEEDDMYGQTWQRGFSLAALVNHEIHHRGQMTVLMRQAGGMVPGLFGPSKEEWSQWGMSEPSY
jgi:uncharacterized damage-inducible protein DinB